MKTAKRHNCQENKVCGVSTVLPHVEDPAGRVEMGSDGRESDSEDDSSGEEDNFNQSAAKLAQQNIDPADAEIVSAIAKSV